MARQLLTSSGSVAQDSNPVRRAYAQDWNPVPQHLAGSGWKRDETDHGNEQPVETRCAGGAVDSLPAVQGHHLPQGSGEPVNGLPRMRLPFLLARSGTNPAIAR